MGDDDEWMKLPADEKIQHKQWKARMAGYEQCVKTFPTLEEKSPEFFKYLGLVKKMVIDNNAIAQEKALEAVLLFVENAHVAGKATSEVCSGVITKCLNASRTKTKEKGMEILLMYIEIEKTDIVLEELLKGLTNKQPKVVAGCVLVLRTAIRDFGHKAIGIKPIVKQIQKLLEDRDKNVREETKLMVIEMYRWVGAALKPQLTNLKPVQISELETEFEKLPPGKPMQTRFLRSQQDLKEKLEAEAAAAAAAGGEDGEEAEDEDDGAAEDMDPYELMDPVEIISKLPKDFYEKIEAKKWQERKEVLEAAQKLTENPKLEQGDYHDFVKVLKKVISKDTNVMLVVIAAKCVKGLAVGLRKKFSPLAPGCVDALVEKFKEKKITVVTALREAIDAVFQTTSLEPISESLIEALGHKTPTVRSETAAFLARSFAFCTMATLPKKMLKAFIAPLLKTVNDTTPDVREASYQALGTAMRVVGEKPIMPFLADVDNIKLQKIKEYSEKAELHGKAAKAAPKPKPAPAAAPAKAPAAKAPAKTGAKPAASKAKASDKPKSAGKPAKKGAGGAKKGGSDKDEFMENMMSDETVEEKASDLIGEATVKNLASANWKERLAAMEKFTETVTLMEPKQIPCQVCIRTIAKKPGLKDNNFQVLKLKAELIGHVCKNGKLSKQTADCVLTDMVDKAGDVKNGAAIKEGFSCMAEGCGLEYISNRVIALAFEQKNPKNQSESLNWLSNAVKEFGFKVNIKPLIQYLKKAFSATNPAVRTAAISLVAVLYMYMGQTLRVFFEDEKAALLQQIDAEIEKVKGEKPPAATRGQTAAEQAEVEEEEDEEEGGESGGGMNIADLVPRNDICDKITDSLITELGDKNWKIRNEALQKVTAILNEAKFIKPNIGSLPEALKIRLGDSNKILVTSTLNICQTIATAMGPNVKQHVPILGPGIINNFGDSKPQIRATANACLTTWVEQCGLVVFVQGEMFSDALKLENPNLRSELLGWLAKMLPNYKKLGPELNLCVPFIFACLEDRNADVRKKADEAVLPFMIHTGYEAMARLATKLKASSKDKVVKCLEAAKPNLPAKPVKAKATRPTTAPAAAAAPSQPDDISPDDPSETESAVSSAPSAASSKPAAGKSRAKVGAAKKPPPTSKSKKGEEEDMSPPLKHSNGKDQRIKDEKSNKVLKWNFGAPRGEFVDQLKAQMEGTVGGGLMEKLYHKDFKKHIQGIEVLIKCVDDMPQETIASLDMILRWLTLKFFETNTSVLMKALEYLQVLFSMLGSEDYHLQEIEAYAFIPYLVNKVGDPKDNIRKDIRNIFKLICQVYPASKMFSYIIDGIKSKNSKQRMECLEELGCLIDIYGINVCQPSVAQALKQIAQQISDRDNSVRSAALNTIVSAYLILGENVYKYVGHLKEKDQSMLDERIKRSSKTRPASQEVQVAPPKKTTPEDKPTKNAPAPRPMGSSRLAAPSARAPKRGEFQLELDDDDTQAPEMPQLIQHDLDDILNDPIELPKTRMRPPSPSMKLLTGSNNVRSAINVVISQVASNDILSSIQGLAQIDEVLKDMNKAELFEEHVDQFLIACTIQMRMVYNKHMGDVHIDKESVVRLYKCLLATMLALFQCGNLGKQSSRDVLKDVIYNLLTIMLDNRLQELEDGTQVVRSVNIMVVKIVEKSDPTNVMSALIKLMHESVASEMSSEKFLELVMKCLWKMVRMLPNIINDLFVDRIIGDLHQFLTAFPCHTWRDRGNDTPLRTVKTILHSLVKLKGSRILSHLSHIDNQQSDVRQYINKVLSNGLNGNALAEHNQNEQNGTPDSGVELRTPKRSTSSSSKSKRLSKTTHDMLAEIFKKIGSKENTREGLKDLHEFKKKYPEADIQPFLKKSSQFFQDYIERNLKAIEASEEQKANAPPTSLTSSSSGGSLNNNTGPAVHDNNGEGDTQPMWERLRKLQARMGRENASNGNDAPAELPAARPVAELQNQAARLTDSSSSLSSNSSAGLPNVGGGEGEAPVSNNETPASNLQDLKRRLERIKNSSAR